MYNAVYVLYVIMSIIICNVCMYVSLYCLCVRLNPSHTSTWCLMVTADSTLLANMTGITYYPSKFYGHVILTCDSYRSIAYTTQLIVTSIITQLDL